MRRRVGATALCMLAALTACGAQAASNHAAVGPSPTLCAPVSAAPVISDKATRPISTPDLRPDADRQKEIDQFTARAHDCVTAWLDHLHPATLAIGGLPHAMSIADCVTPPYRTLEEAAAHAVDIVVGAVTSVTATPDGPAQGYSGPGWTATVDVAVRRAVKGHLNGSVTLHQATWLEPSADWRSAVIVDSCEGSLLLPGQSVILLLDSHDGWLWPQAFTGNWFVHNDLVAPDPSVFGTFGRDITGMGVDAFVARLS